MVRHYVFAYGSLITPGPAGAGRGALSMLNHYRRSWTVAMDNTVDIPGYKYYVEAATGRRPEVFVTFLDIYPRTDAAVNGLLVPVTAAGLGQLDRRERNYRRVDVTAAITPRVDGVVWAYAGSEAARARYRAGVAGNRAVVSSRYARDVRAAFGSYGTRAAGYFEQSTDPPRVPVAALERVDLPGGPGFAVPVGDA